MDMKECRACGRQFPRTPEYFHRHRAMKDGLCSLCKGCACAEKRQYRRDNPEKMREIDRARAEKERDHRKAYSREYYKKHRDEFIERSKRISKEKAEANRKAKEEYYLAHKDEIEVEKREKELKRKEKEREHNKLYREQNRDRLREYGIQYRRKNAEILAEKKRQWRAENPHESRQRVKKYQEEHPEVRKRARDNYRNTPAGRIRVVVGNRIRDTLQRKKNGREWQKIVGYTVDDLVAHIEAQFQDGMSWKNYGEWHIDHIRPVVSFDFEVEDPFLVAKECWALSNLRPLWAMENLKKGAKYTEEVVCCGF